MRKGGLIGLICLIVVVLFTASLYAATEAGRVLTVKRNVYLVRDEQRKSAKPQMSLLMKDIVETDRKSRTKLFFSDDSILSLGQLSRIMVEEYLYSPSKNRSKSIYRLIDGSLKVVVGRSDLEIHTPSAVAAARGTKFIMWAKGSGDSMVSCAMVLEGVVVLRNIRKEIEGTVTLREGTKSCVPVGKPPGNIQPITQQELKDHTDNTVVLGSISEEIDRLPKPLPVQGDEDVQTGVADVAVPPVPQQQPSTDTFTPVNITIVFPGEGS
jgi:hypothetical protein